MQVRGMTALERWLYYAGLGYDCIREVAVLRRSGMTALERWPYYAGLGYDCIREVVVLCRSGI